MLVHLASNTWTYLCYRTDFIPVQCTSSVCLQVTETHQEANQICHIPACGQPSASSFSPACTGSSLWSKHLNEKTNLRYEETLSLHVNPPETLNQPWMSFREGFRPRTILLPLFLKLFKLSFIFQNILRVNITNPRVGIESKQRSKWKWNLWWVSACGSEPAFRRMQIWHSLLLWY